MSVFRHLVVSAVALGVTALRFQELAQRHVHREPNCALGDLENEVMSTTDIFMRSYRGDLEWLDFSVPSITESMQCSLGVIRNVLVVVPEDDVPDFNAKLDAVWQREQFPTRLRERWQVKPSQVKVVGDGYQEQMLDKLHTDLYSDAKHFVYLDTDTVLVRDLTREQLFNDVGQPYLCHRSVAKCGKDCEMWMQEHVKPMLGEGEMLEHEFMCLGEAFPRYLYAHIRFEVQRHKGDEWHNFTANARAGGASPWAEPGGVGGFTEFNAMGAVMWRDFHEQPHWLDTDTKDLDMMARPLQTWSWEEDEAKREAAKRRFQCIRELQHDTENFDYNSRVVTCDKKAESIEG
jgi:hypothetical protein